MEEKRSTTEDSANIWWVAGYPKSGTTWLRLFLSGYLYGHVDVNMPIALADTMPYMYQSVAPIAIDKLKEWEVAALRDAVLIHQTHFAGVGKRLFVKTHNLMGNWAGIHYFHPNIYRAGIYVIRDPRDIVDSLADHTGLTHDEAIEFMEKSSLLYSGKSKIHHALGDWSQNVSSWTNSDKVPGPCLVIKYEDMPHIFRKVAEFITPSGEVVDEVKLRMSIEGTAFDKIQKAEEEHGFNEKSPKSERFFRYGQVGRWKEILTDEQVKRIEAKHGETMKKCGYKLSTEEEETDEHTE